MGKEGELWDDSALIKAFDDAISKYKKMHGKRSSNGEAKKVVADDSASNGANEEENNSHLETNNEDQNETSHASLEVAEAEVKDIGSEVATLQVPEEQVIGSSNLDETQNYSSSSAVDEYNHLYKQYYEIEEQRQKILQKLQELSSSGYANVPEASDSGVQWGATSATQEYQASVSQAAPCGTMIVSCCPYACPCSSSCSALPCPTLVACACTLSHDPSASMGLQKQPADEDAGIVKMAMGAVERAMSTLKDSSSDSKGDNKTAGEADSYAAGETDLSKVLSAWYSAGFYTGKYLAEQSLAKKQHG